MGNNIFTLHIPEIGETQSIPLYVESLEFVKGWWSTDKDGKELLKKAKLGDTVYFHVNVKGLADGQEITLKLAELDYYFGVDNIDPDDRKFPEEEVVKTAIINNDKAVVKLVLQDSWDVMIKDDSDELGNLDSTLELYWEIEYGKYKKALPAEDKDYLRVGYNDRTLFILPAADDYFLPELADFEGNPLILMNYSKSVYSNAKGELFDAINNSLDDKITHIALAKLENGFLATNKDNVFVKNTQLYTKDVYTNDGTLLKDVKMRRQFGFDHGDGLETTTTVSQVDFFSKKGYKVKILGAVKNVGNALDIIDLANFATSDLNLSDSVALPMGALTPFSEIANMLISEEKARIDSFLEHSYLQMLLKAKSKDLKHVEAFVDAYGDETDYFTENISKETARELLFNNFKTLEELYDFEDNLDFQDMSYAVILCRRIKHKSRNSETNIVETIYLNH